MMTSDSDRALGAALRATLVADRDRAFALPIARKIVRQKRVARWAGVVLSLVAATGAAFAAEVLRRLVLTALPAVQSVLSDHLILPEISLIAALALLAAALVMLSD
jgi:hypothetical protein